MSSMAIIAQGDFYIEDGVHRAVALRENGVQTPIPAVLHEAGKPTQDVFVFLNQLYSPKRTVSRIPNHRHDFLRTLAWLSTPLGRSQMPPIHIQPLGEPAQSSSIPLSQVQILN